MEDESEGKETAKGLKERGRMREGCEGREFEGKGRR